jgi:multidrug efflux pump subunit AcrA (membrane-fusion protein)
MVVSVRVGGEKDHKVMLLPMAAIHQGQSPDELMVYEVVGENGRDVARARKVALGGIFNNQVEVLSVGSEVRAGSKAVVTTAERLTDGTFVRMMEDNSASPDAMSEAK